MVTGYELFSVKGRSDQPKYLMRTQLSEQILAASTAKDTKKAKYVFRPPSLKDNPEPLFKMSLDELLLHRLIMLPIFQRLPTSDLANCALVCKSWNKIIQDPSLWSTVRFENWKITSHILSLIGELKHFTLIDLTGVKKLKCYTQPCRFRIVHSYETMSFNMPYAIITRS